MTAATVDAGLELIPEAQALYDSDEPFEVALLDRSLHELEGIDGYERKLFASVMRWTFPKAVPVKRFSVGGVAFFSIGGREIGVKTFNPLWMQSGDGLQVTWRQP